jgi:excisionase family DNA binding protein
VQSEAEAVDSKKRRGGPPVAGGELYRVAEVAECLALSRSKLYALMDAGDLPYVKIGRSRRISAAAVNDLVELCRVRR